MKISVIVPVYNAEKYLAQALDSVLAQTYVDYECVCVNDGSTDASAEILAQYEQKFCQVGRLLRIVTQENGGVSSARNAGLDVAQGEYITWLDSDDMLAPTRFDVAARIIEKELPDLVWLHYQMGEREPERFAAPDYLYETMVSEKQIFHCGWGELNANGMGWLWFAKRTLLEGMRFRANMTVKEDCIFSSSLIPKIKKLCVSSDKGIFYRQCPKSLMHSARKAQDCVNCQKAFLDLWKEQKDYAASIGELEYLQRRLKWCSQSDLLDWIRWRPENEAKSAQDEVRRAYLMMRNSGAYSSRFVLKSRYRWVLPLYDAFGWLWPIQCVEGLLMIYRRLLKR